MDIYIDAILIFKKIGSLGMNCRFGACCFAICRFQFPCHNAVSVEGIPWARLPITIISTMVPWGPGNADRRGRTGEGGGDLTQSDYNKMRRDLPIV